jgi:hypothetical protein
MSRRIQTGYRVAAPAGTAKLSDSDVKPTVEDFSGRLAKYIPAEIVGLYLAAAGFVPKGHPKEMAALWTIFGLCWVLTLIYLILATRDKEYRKGPLWIQVIVGTVAFPFWVFAIGGPFVSLSWYEPFIASIVLVFVTFIFGWRIKPRKES